MRTDWFGKGCSLFLLLALLVLVVPVAQATNDSGLSIPETELASINGIQNGWQYWKYSNNGTAPCDTLNNQDINTPPMWLWWDGSNPVQAQNYTGTSAPYVHPCGAGYWNWFAVKPTAITSWAAPWRFHASYTLNWYWAQSQAGSTAIPMVGVVYVWNIPGYPAARHEIELSLNDDGSGDWDPNSARMSWGYWYDYTNNYWIEYLRLSYSQMFGGSPVLPNNGVDKFIYIDWQYIMRYSLSRGWFTCPTGNNWSGAYTSHGFVSDEVYNGQAGQSVLAALETKTFTAGDLGYSMPGTCPY